MNAIDRNNARNQGLLDYDGLYPEGIWDTSSASDYPVLACEQRAEDYSHEEVEMSLVDEMTLALDTVEGRPLERYFQVIDGLRKLIYQVRTRPELYAISDEAIALDEAMSLRHKWFVPKPGKSADERLMPDLQRREIQLHNTGVIVLSRVELLRMQEEMMT